MVTTSVVLRSTFAVVQPDEDWLTGLVIGSAHRVFNTLGGGLPEVPYVGALAYECEKLGLAVDREWRIAVHYEGIVVGNYRADLLIAGELIVEVKACPLHSEHHRQVITYLRCSRMERALLIGFDDRPIVKRFVFRNELKPWLARETTGRVGTGPEPSDAEGTGKGREGAGHHRSD